MYVSARCEHPPPHPPRALGASKQCLPWLVKNPKCSVRGFVGIRGVYGHTTTAMHDMSTPQTQPRKHVLLCYGLYGSHSATQSTDHTDHTEIRHVPAVNDLLQIMKEGIDHLSDPDGVNMFRTPPP